MTTAPGGETPSAADVAAQALLGAMLWDPQRVREVSGWLEAGDFYRPDHGAIYATLVGLLADRRSDVDVFTVLASLQRGDHHDLHVDGSGSGPLSASRLHDLISMTPATPRAEDFRANFGAEARSEHVRYARIVQEDSIRRQVQALGTRIGQHARQVPDRDSSEAAAVVAPVLAEARARLRELAGRLAGAGAGRASITAALNPAASPAAALEARSERRPAPRRRTGGEGQVRRAEAQLIGACLVSTEVRRLVHGHLRASDFAVPEAAATWKAIETLHDRGEPIDFVLVAAQVERQGALPGVGRGLRPDHLHQLATRSDEVTGYRALQTVVRAALARTLHQATEHLHGLAADRTRSGADLLSSAEHVIDQATAITRRLAANDNSMNPASRELTAAILGLLAAADQAVQRDGEAQRRSRAATAAPAVTSSGQRARGSTVGSALAATTSPAPPIPAARQPSPNVPGSPRSAAPRPPDHPSRRR